MAAHMTNMTGSLADKKKIWVLLFAAFVDMLGYAMVFPLLPFYAVRLGADAQVIGWMIASFSIAQVAAAPLWGRFSDRWGRRPALLFGLIGSAVAFLIFGFATAVWLLFLSRLAQGAAGGTTSVMQAYIADSVVPEERAKALGWLSAATNTGVMLGPVLGSLSWQLGSEAPGVIAAALCFLNFVFAFRWLPESSSVDTVAAAETMKAMGELPEKKKSVRKMVWETMIHPTSDTAQLIWIYATAMMAFGSMTAVLGLYLMERFGMDESNIGYIFLYLGALSVIMRAGLLGRLVTALGEVTLMRAGALLVCAGLSLMAFPDHLAAFLGVMTLFPIGTALLFPSTTGLLSRRGGKSQMGQLMGVQQAFGGCSRIVGPIWAGAAFRYFGPTVPFQVAGAIVGIVFFLTLQVRAEPHTGPSPNGSSGVVDHGENHSRRL
jgi:MFS family permease